jgi:hypothetical protein
VDTHRTADFNHSLLFPLLMILLVPNPTVARRTKPSNLPPGGVLL